MKTIDFLYKTIMEAVNKEKDCMKFDFSLEEDKENYIILSENLI